MIKSAAFVTSNTDYKKCPPANKPEFAFIGRSNVGKSSLINMLTGQKKLAKTSSRPGKTQLINHFIINEKWYLVDLPGYGWAKVSKTQKAKWGPMVSDYLTHRENLACLFVLIDSRLEPQNIDIEFINWVGEQGIPMALVFTKADKQTMNKTMASVALFKRTMKKTWEDLPDMMISSAETGLGKEEVLNFIQEVMDNSAN